MKDERNIFFEEEDDEKEAPFIFKTFFCTIRVSEILLKHGLYSTETSGNQSINYY